MSKKEIYLVPYSHLDTQWRWEFPTTINKYIRKTMDQNIRMFKKYPEHRFNFTGALRYQMMKEYFPEKFEEVKRLIQEKRWHLAGTCLDETDALVPSVESLVRNILYGHHWQLEEFGRSSKDYMIPDCFGFPENLPTVMQHCRINGFSSNKLTWGSAVGIPFEIGKWAGPDGSETVCAFNPCRYDAHLELPIFMNPGRQKRLMNLGKKNGVWKSFQYYGVGDIGGAPTEGSIKRAIRSMRFSGKPGSKLTVRQGAADRFFDELTDDEIRKMDTYRGDLLLVTHSAGSLTSAAIMKRWNRKNEQMAFAAEGAAVQAWLTAGVSYPAEKIKKAWQRVIACQMHDILPGTCTPTAYEYSHNDEVLAMNSYASVLEDSAAALANHIPGEGRLLLFNPYEGEREDYTDVVLNGIDSSKSYLLKDADRNTYPAQCRKTDQGNVLTFRPRMSAFGWSKFDLVQGKAEDTALSLELENGIFTLQNEYYRIRISETGCLDSIFDKKRGREILRRPLAYEFQKERPMKFPAWDMDWRDRKKNPYLSVENNGRVEVIEDGNLRKTLRITYLVNDSKLVREVSLAEGDEQVNFTERIHWRSSGCSLKLRLHVDMENPEFTYNWETSRKQRGVNRKKQFEVPSRFWVDVRTQDFGVSLVEDSKYGYDRPDASTLRMTLLHTPALRYINGFCDQKTHDWGDHTIRYALKSHNGTFGGADDLARRFNQPLRSYRVEQRKDALGAVPSDTALFNLEGDQFGVLSVKKAEKHDAVVVRLYERFGKAGDAVLNFPWKIEKAWEVNGIEEILGELPAGTDQLSIPVAANGLKALMLRCKMPSRKASIKQKQIELPMNRILFSANGDENEGLIPMELVPGTLEDGNLTFHIQANREYNAMGCTNNVLDLASGFNNLTLLGGSDRGKEIALEWLDEKGNLLITQNLKVPALTGYLGQWDRRTWRRKPRHTQRMRSDYAWLNKCTGVEPGYIKRSRVAWFSMHSHRNGEDRAYECAYLNRLTLPLPRGAAKLRLPQDPDVRIAAATLWFSNQIVESCQYLHDRYDY